MSSRPLLRVYCPSAEQNQLFVKALLPLLSVNDKIVLSGALGAGKTHLVAQLLKALGFEGRVCSPSFTLVNEYKVALSRCPLSFRPSVKIKASNWPVKHVDLYRLIEVDRLERDKQLFEIGAEEWFTLPGLVLVEWGAAFNSLSGFFTKQIEIVFQGEGREFLLSSYPPHPRKLRSTS